MAALAEFAVVL